MSSVNDGPPTPSRPTATIHQNTIDSCRMLNWLQSDQVSCLLAFRSSCWLPTQPPPSLCASGSPFPSDTNCADSPDDSSHPKFRCFLNLTTGLVDGSDALKALRPPVTLLNLTFIEGCCMPPVKIAFIQEAHLFSLFFIGPVPSSFPISAVSIATWLVEYATPSPPASMFRLLHGFWYRPISLDFSFLRVLSSSYQPPDYFYFMLLNTFQFIFCLAPLHMPRMDQILEDWEINKKLQELLA